MILKIQDYMFNVINDNISRTELTCGIYPPCYNTEQLSKDETWKYLLRWQSYIAHLSEQFTIGETPELKVEFESEIYYKTPICRYIDGTTDSSIVYHELYPRILKLDEDNLFEKGIVIFEYKYSSIDDKIINRPSYLTDIITNLNK